MNIENLAKSTNRIRRDVQKFFDYLESLESKEYGNKIEDYEQRMLDIDQALANMVLLVSFLQIEQMMLYSNEYPPEMFEALSLSKAEFSSQVINLLSHFKSLSFVLTERSRIAREIWKTKVDREESLVDKEKRFGKPKEN